MNIHIDPEIASKLQNIRLGILQIQGTVKPSPPSLLEIIKTESERIRNKYETTTIKIHPVISETRKAYQILGKEPSRYRPSAEALYRRLVRGLDLYLINNVVEIINLTSLHTGFSIGGYDATKINGDVLLKKGGTEEYNAIGRGQLNIKNLPVLFDQSGPFGSPTSDSERTMITNSTKQILLVFYDFNSNEHLMSAIEFATQLFEEFSGARHIDSKLI